MRTGMIRMTYQAFSLHDLIKFRPYPQAFNILPDLRPDDDGLCTMFVWEFMKTFGPHMGLGRLPVVQVEVYIQAS